MDDLLIFIRALFVGDATLLAAYVAAGASAVSVLTPSQRTVASYPRIIIEGEEGEQVSFGENARAKFFDGHVRIEIVTRKSDANPQPLLTLYQIKNRITDLLLGNQLLGIPGIKGHPVSANYNIPIFKEVRPTGLIKPQTDVTVERWRGTYAVQLNRIGF